MSQRLRETFERGRRDGRTLFMPYLTGGYPRRDDTVRLLLALEAAGGDVIELGVPFTDPLADGATIQHANQVAVEQGVSLVDCLGYVAEARAAGLEAPVLLMGYYNPIVAVGEEECCRRAAEAGVDGFIVVDLPPEEAGVLLAGCHRYDLSMVPLVAPTTSDERVARLASVADAFLYCVSVTGTTGARQELPAELGEFLGRVRRVTSLPLAVGFGISTRAHVERVGAVAEAAIVGSGIIAAIDAGEADGCVERVRAFVEDLSGRGIGSTP
jgi:tryptophan synthase alpha subunit